MDAIWDRDGRQVGWWDRDSGAIFDAAGQRHVGYASNSGLYSQQGQPKGGFGDGYFKDEQGYPVAFIDGAAGGPSLPYTGAAPYVGSTPYVGGAPYLQGSGWSPPTQMSWSPKSLVDLLV